MPATFGLGTALITAPTGAYISDQSEDSSVEIAEVRNSAGAVVIALPKKLVTKNITISGKGGADIAEVTASVIAAGVGGGSAMKILSVKGTESNNEFGDFEVTAIQYEDLT